jgi:hypothetical protein
LSGVFVFACRLAFEIHALHFIRRNRATIFSFDAAIGIAEEVLAGDRVTGGIVHESLIIAAGVSQQALDPFEQFLRFVAKVIEGFVCFAQLLGQTPICDKKQQGLLPLLTTTLRVVVARRATPSEREKLLFTLLLGVLNDLFEFQLDHRHIERAEQHAFDGFKSRFQIGEIFYVLFQCFCHTQLL